MFWIHQSSPKSYNPLHDDQENQKEWKGLCVSGGLGLTVSELPGLGR